MPASNDEKINNILYLLSIRLRYKQKSKYPIITV